MRRLFKDDTGFTNLFTVYRPSVTWWIQQNRRKVENILEAASRAQTHDDRRDVALLLEDLPSIPKPSEVEGGMRAQNLLSPVLACLDPNHMFPILNGNKGVQTLLAKLKLKSSRTAYQVDGLMFYIRQGWCRDAFELDMVRKDVIRLFKQKPPKTKVAGTLVSGNLGLKDSSDVLAVHKTGTYKMTHLHNKMTNALLKICAKKRPLEGKDQHAMYDALLPKYDSAGRDLLIEAKSSTDRGTVRLAIGQLLDYRRHLPDQHKTDLAILLPEKPSSDTLDLLAGLDIAVLWFTNKSLKDVASSRPGLQLART